MTLLSERLQQTDMVGLSDAEAANALNASNPSWAEANGIPVDAEAVAAARASAQAVTILGWVNSGPAPGGGVHEQCRVLLPSGAEVAPIFHLPVAGNDTLRSATLNEWLVSNAYLLS
jgi:hypothetical protein